MPWKSKAQMRAAYGGHLGPEMKKKAAEYSRATPDISALPEHAKKRNKGPAVPDLRRLRRS